MQNRRKVDELHNSQKDNQKSKSNLMRARGILYFSFTQSNLRRVQKDDAEDRLERKEIQC